MKLLSTRTRISMGLVFLVISAMISASLFGLVPDRISAVREGRIALAESLAAASSAIPENQDPRRLEDVLRSVRNKNASLLSAGVRAQDGKLVAVTGDHARNWLGMDSPGAGDSQIQVRLFAGARPLGELELRFEPLASPGLLGFLQRPLIPLLAFCAGLCFVAFQVVLHRALRHLPPPAEVLEPQPAAGAAKGRWRIPASRVLVVDDAAETRELLSLVLAEQGLSTEEAQNGQVALNQVAAGAFDLILMDMNMPVMDGYTAVRALRSRGVATPIVAFSANAKKGHEEEALAAGCNACLTKPVDLDLLLASVARFLGGERLAEAAPTHSVDIVATAPAALPSEAAPVAFPLPDEIHSRFASHPRLSPIVSKFAGRLREKLGQAREAHSEGDFEELGRFAHWLAGSGGMMGYDSLTAPARELESLARTSDVEASAAVLTQLDRMCVRLVIPSHSPLPDSGRS